MSNIINLDALGSAEMRTEPYPWACYTDAMRDPEGLIESFPTDGFEWHSQRRLLETIGKRGSDPWFQHSVATRPLLELGADKPRDTAELDEQWLAVAEDLVSAEYRECLSDLTGYDVRGLRLQAHFWRFDQGSFFQPHIDKAHKIVTHLMYLTENWSPEMGGCFRVLRSNDPDDVHTEIPPLTNNSIVLRRTDNAWHAVSPIPRESNRSRRLLQVWFWDD
ncbi:2OG-Fe(II) oxygenase [Streptomyces sp. NPDC056661]|uniref:2OG-Fe(II) oxygenase n=1 Tax=Streptomyces sp. NPDC056661 TaxID=3345898 RepID=UPI003691928A